MSTVTIGKRASDLSRSLLRNCEVVFKRVVNFSECYILMVSGYLDLRELLPSVCLFNKLDKNDICLRNSSFTTNIMFFCITLGVQSNYPNVIDILVSVFFIMKSRIRYKIS